MSRLGARSRVGARPSAPATSSSTGLYQRGDPPGRLLAGVGWEPLFSSFTPRPRPSFGGGESLLFVFVRGTMPSACRQMGRGVLSMSVYKPSPLFFQSKAGPQSKERASVGVLQQRRKMDSVGLFGRGCAFLARWMAPSALAVMQHNAAVLQPPLVLAAGAWHGHSAPAAPARPHPGLGLPLAAAGSCFYLVYLVMLLQLDVASGGPGHLAVKGGGRCSLG